MKKFIGENVHIPDNQKKSHEKEIVLSERIENLFEKMSNYY